MPFAVIGVRKDAMEDGPSAVICVRDNIQTREEALEVHDRYSGTDEARIRFAELYLERHDGDRWRPAGGRCYFQAMSFFLAKYEALLDAGYLGKAPQLVHGYCILPNPDRTAELSGHAWIEGGDFVLDCGSYILKPAKYEKDEFYRRTKAVVAHRYTYTEATERFKKYGGTPFPWGQPPEHDQLAIQVWNRLQSEA